MKFEERTFITKSALAVALKKQLAVKPISRITIQSLVDECQLNRKTFYYHFADVYELLVWMLEQEAIGIIKEFDLLLDFQEAIGFSVKYIRENREMLRHVLDSIGREQLKRCFYDDFYEVVSMAIEQKEKQRGIILSVKYKEFLKLIYTEMVGATVELGIKQDCEPEQEEAIFFLNMILNSSLEGAVSSAEGPALSGDTGCITRF